MGYYVKIVEPAEVMTLLTASIEEYAYGGRLVDKKMTAADYFRHLDRTNPEHAYLAAYVESGPDDDTPDVDPSPAGVARIAFYDSPPTFHHLPGDARFVLVDEIYVAGPHRARGTFAALVNTVRTYSLRRGVEYVFCRVGSRALARHFIGYGLHPLPVYTGRLRDLRLPEVF